MLQESLTNPNKNNSQEHNDDVLWIASVFQLLMNLYKKLS